MSQKDTAGLKMDDLENPDESPIQKAIRQSVAAADPSKGDAMGAVDPMAPPASPESPAGTLPFDPGSLGVSGTGGVAGDLAKTGGNAGAPMGGGAAPSTPDYRKLGQFADRMGPWNAGNEKFQKPWDDMSERYQMMTVLSNFDPRQGLTPEVIDALNKANIRGAKFSGQGDKLNVDNAGGWERFGKGGTADVITGLKGGNGTWNPWSDPALEGQGAGGGGGVPAGHNVNMPNPLMAGLGNDALMSDDFFRKLMEGAQRTAGPASTDPRALSALLGL